MCKTSCGKTSNHNTKRCSTIDPVNEGPCIRLHTPRTHPTARKVHLAVGTLQEVYNRKQLNLFEWNSHPGV